MISLGLDTAQVNLGVTVLKESEEILFHKTFNKCSKRTLIEKNLYQEFVLNTLLDKFKPDFVGLEAPAFGAKFQMVSIGSIHGIFISNLIRRNTPFIWVPPTKIRYAYFESGDKKKGIYVVKNSFIFNSASGVKHPVDDNVADAAVLAHLAYLFFKYFINGLNPPDKEVFPADRKKLEEIVLSSKTNKSSQAQGLIHRPFEFYWTPNLKLWFK